MHLFLEGKAQYVFTAVGTDNQIGEGSRGCLGICCIINFNFIGIGRRYNLIGHTGRFKILILHISHNGILFEFIADFEGVIIAVEYIIGQVTEGCAVT